MQESSARHSLLALVQSAVSAGREGARSLPDLTGVALFDPERDQRLTSLPTFLPASAQILGLPHFAERMGGGASERICLQFVYDYFARAKGVVFDQPTFDELWSDFIAELEEPLHRWRGVANLTHFGGHVARLTGTGNDRIAIELGDGVSIRGRHFEDLAILGFSEHVLKQLAEDWGDGPGASSFVLVADHSAPKSPDNIVLTESVPWVKSMRAVGAMRLLGGGDVGMGPMWIARPARFNIGVGGSGRVGMSVPNWGHPYDWTDEVEASFPTMYRALARLEQTGYSRGIGNLGLALRSFMATYDRWPAGNDSKLLDTVTSLEATLGTDSEISFKLAFRVASILAGNDEERSDLMKLVKGFYDARSKLVHGGSLKQKQTDLIARVDELRALLRRLLHSFVLLAIDESSPFGHQFFVSDLDSALVSGAARERLRTAMGLA